MEQKITTDQDYLEVANKFRCGLLLRGFNLNIHPAQIPDEILSLLITIRQINPKIILKIGTATGGTLYLFTKLANPNALIISLDLP